MKFASYNIVFQEIPGEVTLAINLSNCPNRCKGCHSPYLMEDKGEILNEDRLVELLEKYGNAITCVCFMGGDAEPQELERYSVFLRNQSNGQIKIGWYSGKNTFPKECSLQNFDYVKLGAYVEHLGGLDSTTSNQRFYRIDKGQMMDMTEYFHKNAKFANI
ncbi:MAG: anaerobic ribonucleoside-triphosphate reductase activating protein [Prevotellaceae bacterium]|jgi:anaerobic ribonucleoside-triphosphate reductase activating protein|nr:anaerobic ribonucleoside-triphosphate reductase activating protein [Prevotellaceae bacterium]